MNNALLRPRIASSLVRFTDVLAVYKLHSNTASLPRSATCLAPAQNRAALKFSAAFRRCSPICSMASSLPSSIYDITVKNIRGEDVCLEKYKGKVLLIVNVASQCGLTTSNYTELNEVYQKYREKGLEILAFPCNQFGGQEPGSNEEIQNFVCTRFQAEYPIFDKVDVNGGDAHPLYKYLKHAKGGILGDAIKWNFTKFLVNKNGEVVERYAPTTSPLKIEKDVLKYL